MAVDRLSVTVPSELGAALRALAAAPRRFADQFDDQLINQVDSSGIQMPQTD